MAVSYDTSKKKKKKSLDEHSLLPSRRFGVYKKNELHPRYLFHLQNIRFKLQIQSLIQSFILKNATLIFLNPSTTAGILQV